MRRAPRPRTCRWCDGRIHETARVDAIYCSVRCRQAGNRAKIRRVELEATARPLRLAYADPPYPGKAWMYRDHPDYAGEVDVDALLSRLATYDGWALSTSAEAVPAIAARCVARVLDVRIAVWIRTPRPHLTARILRGWEAVVFAGGRRVVRDVDGRVAQDLQRPILQVADTLVGVDARARSTLPTAVVGMKPPAFCEWVFRLLGALPGDTLDDLYPGSGIVGRTWRDYTGADAGVDASIGAAGDASRHDVDARRLLDPNATRRASIEPSRVAAAMADA